MKNNQLNQLTLVNIVYKKKLQRLEIQHQKAQRKVENEYKLLESLKQDLKNAHDAFDNERDDWKIRAESEPQTQEKILTMRYKFHLLQEKINHVHSHIEEQKKTISEHERIVKELKNAVVKMNIKVEKLSFVQEQPW